MICDCGFYIDAQTSKQLKVNKIICKCGKVYVTDSTLIGYLPLSDYKEPNHIRELREYFTKQL